MYFCPKIKRMKLRAYLIIFILACISMSCYGQVVIDKSYMTIGKIESDGVVRDRSNMTIGRFDGDGVIMDKNNMTIGKIESDGTIRDRSNMKIGCI